MEDLKCPHWYGEKDHVLCDMPHFGQEEFRDTPHCAHCLAALTPAQVAALKNKEEKRED
jgi:hypothetical protein